MQKIETLIHKAVMAALDAGQEIMRIYGTEFSIEYKDDLSPLTQADKAAHSIIADQLSFSGLPLLSEEGIGIPYEIRKNWKYFWMVDPLDGTKEFVNRNGDFTVNIALINENRPLAGVIYAPVLDICYYALPGHGAFKVKGDIIRHLDFAGLIAASFKLPETNHTNEYIIVASRSHQNQATTDYIKSLNKPGKEIKFVSRGSSLKFCALSEGSADLYPRMGPTMEWDTAAGHAIALLAGCTIVNPLTQSALLYNKESLLNPYFVVERK